MSSLRTTCYDGSVITSTIDYDVDGRTISHTLHTADGSFWASTHESECENQPGWGTEDEEELLLAEAHREAVRATLSKELTYA